MYPAYRVHSHNKGGMMMGRLDLLLALQTEGPGSLNRNLCFCLDRLLWL